MPRLLLALLLVFAVSSCGDDGPTAAEKAEASESAEAERFAAAAEANASEAAAAAAAAEARKRAAQEKRYQACSNGTKDLAGALAEIDSRLGIGMNFDEYGERVGDAQVAYDQLFKGPDLARTCLLEVAIPLEGALNKYIEVYNIWNECISDYACDFSEGETNDKVQKRWAKATRILGNADAGLNGMQP